MNSARTNQFNGNNSVSAPNSITLGVIILSIENINTNVQY